MCATMANIEDVEQLVEESTETIVSPSETQKTEEAHELKRHGNSAMSQGDYEKAKKHYLESLRMCKKLSNDPEIEELIKTLYLNLSMCYIHLMDWSRASSTATAALRYDPTNVKAFYRRGIARRNSKQWAEAKEDFVEALKLDPTNQKVKQELTTIRRTLSENQDSKKSFGAKFDTNMGLYDDREKKLAETKERQMKEQKMLQEEWRKENDIRKENNEEDIDFEEWKKKRESKQTTHSAAPPAQSPISSPREGDRNALVSNATHDPIEFDEEEQKILDETAKMGYCYFRRELTGEEKRLNEMNKPQRLDATSATGDSFSGDKSLGPAISTWNSAGTTYEEKNMTEWAKSHFIKKIKGTAISINPEDLLNDPSKLNQLVEESSAFMKLLANNDKPSSSTIANAELSKMLGKGSVMATDVSELSGEAHISVIRGRRRFFFEFSCELAFELTVDRSFGMGLTDSLTGENSSKYKGVYKLNDVTNVSSNVTDWLKDSHFVITGTVKPRDKYAVESLMEQFKSALMSSLEQFLEDYKEKS